MGFTAGNLKYLVLVFLPSQLFAIQAVELLPQPAVQRAPGVGRYDSVFAEVQFQLICVR